MQGQNLQPAAKTRFTTSCKDKIYNQLQRQNLQPAAKTKHPTSCKTNLQPAARQNLHGANTKHTTSCKDKIYIKIKYKDKIYSQM
jgi:hypothetical protein